MTVTDELLRACDSTLGAAIEIEYMVQNKEADVNDLHAFIEILEVEYRDVRNVFFFRHLLREQGCSNLQTVTDVQQHMRVVIEKLRTIETFQRGELSWAREFCLACNRALLAESWERFCDRRRLA